MKTTPPRQKRKVQGATAAEKRRERRHGEKIRNAKTGRVASAEARAQARVQARANQAKAWERAALVHR